MDLREQADRVMRQMAAFIQFHRQMAAECGLDFIFLLRRTDRARQSPAQWGEYITGQLYIPDEEQRAWLKRQVTSAMADSAGDAKEMALDLLRRAASTFEHEAPDADWFRDYFLLTGEHGVKTDEGWITGESYRQTVDELKPEMLEEVNAPPTDAKRPPTE